jgi:hypothetical protein
MCAGGGPSRMCSLQSLSVARLAVGGGGGGRLRDAQLNAASFLAPSRPSTATLPLFSIVLCALYTDTACSSPFARIAIALPQSPNRHNPSRIIVSLVGRASFGAVSAVLPRRHDVQLRLNKRRQRRRRRYFTSTRQYRISRLFFYALDTVATCLRTLASTRSSPLRIY